MLVLNDLKLKLGLYFAKKDFSGIWFFDDDDDDDEELFLWQG